MDIDAFILIGGRSSRFGTDKALAEFDGETLAARAARTVQAALSPRHLTFVAASDDQFRERIPFVLDHAIVSDLKPGFGAWSGLHAALACARSDWAFVLACDLPFVSPELLRILAVSSDDASDAVVPRQPDGRLQPLCAFYRVSNVLSVVEKKLDEGRSLPPLADLFQGLKTRVVAPDDYETLENVGDLFRNINTPADLTA